MSYWTRMSRKYGLLDGKKFCLAVDAPGVYHEMDWPEHLATGAVKVVFTEDERWRNVASKAEYDALVAASVMSVEWATKSNGYERPPNIVLVGEWPDSGLTKHILSTWIDPDVRDGAEVTAVDRPSDRQFSRSGQRVSLQRWGNTFVSDDEYVQLRVEAKTRAERHHMEMAAWDEQNG